MNYKTRFLCSTSTLNFNKVFKQKQILDLDLRKFRLFNLSKISTILFLIFLYFYIYF